MKHRVVINLSGFVQGVNMRAMVKMTAVNLNLTGYVKNKDDGSVEIVAEGKKDNLEVLIRWLNEHNGPDKIEKLEDYWSEARNEFEGFTIQY